jgi:hypothetical protein
MDRKHDRLVIRHEAGEGAANNLQAVNLVCSGDAYRLELMVTLGFETGVPAGDDAATPGGD